MIQVVESRCPQDHPCPLVRGCPTGAIRQEGWNAPSIDAETCIECGLCTQSCPYRVFAHDFNEAEHSQSPL